MDGDKCTMEVDLAGVEFEVVVVILGWLFIDFVII